MQGFLTWGLESVYSVEGACKLAGGRGKCNFIFLMSNWNVALHSIMHVGNTAILVALSPREITDIYSWVVLVFFITLELQISQNIGYLYLKMTGRPSYVLPVPARYYC